MKNLVRILAFFVLLSCERDESTDKIITSATNPEGSWSVVKVTAPVAPLVSNFAPNEIKWIFANNSIVTVSNTNTNTSKNDVLDSGNYAYFVTNYQNLTDCNSTIKIDDIERGCVKINGNIMIIDRSLVDGLKIELVKNNP